MTFVEAKACSKRMPRSASASRCGVRTGAGRAARPRWSARWVSEVISVAVPGASTSRTRAIPARAQAAGALPSASSSNLTRASAPARGARSKASSTQPVSSVVASGRGSSSWRGGRPSASTVARTRALRPAMRVSVVSPAETRRRVPSGSLGSAQVAAVPRGRPQPWRVALPMLTAAPGPPSAGRAAAGGRSHSSISSRSTGPPLSSMASPSSWPLPGSSGASITNSTWPSPRGVRAGTGSGTASPAASVERRRRRTGRAPAGSRMAMTIRFRPSGSGPASARLPPAPVGKRRASPSSRGAASPPLVAAHSAGSFGGVSAASRVAAGASKPAGPPGVRRTTAGSDSAPPEQAASRSGRAARSRRWGVGRRTSRSEARV